MKVLLTGAAGRLGVLAGKALVEAGHDVLGCDVVYRRDLPYQLRIVNLLDRLSCYALMDKVDALVHLANHPHAGARPGSQVYVENTAMTANVFQAALECGVKRWVYASSIQAMRGTRQSGVDDRPSELAYLPADGDAPANPGNLYALSKTAGEDMCRYYARYHQVSAVALRFPWLLSIGASSWEKLPMAHPHWFPDELFSFLDMKDAVSLLVAILRSELPGYRCYLPASRQNLYQRPVPELVAEFFPNVPLRTPVEQMAGLIDLSSIERQTGWAPTV